MLLNAFVFHSSTLGYSKKDGDTVLLSGSCTRGLKFWGTRAFRWRRFARREMLENFALTDVNIQLQIYKCTNPFYLFRLALLAYIWVIFPRTELWLFRLTFKKPLLDRCGQTWFDTALFLLFCGEHDHLITLPQSQPPINSLQCTAINSKCTKNALFNWHKTVHFWWILKPLQWIVVNWWGLGLRLWDEKVMLYTDQYKKVA